MKYAGLQEVLQRSPGSRQQDSPKGRYKRPIILV